MLLGQQHGLGSRLMKEDQGCMCWTILDVLLYHLIIYYKVGPTLFIYLFIYFSLASDLTGQVIVGARSKSFGRNQELT